MPSSYSVLFQPTSLSLHSEFPVVDVQFVGDVDLVLELGELGNIGVFFQNLLSLGFPYGTRVSVHLACIKITCTNIVGRHGFGFSGGGRVVVWGRKPSCSCEFSWCIDTRHAAVTYADMS
jgi:hypothetical protein